MTRRIAMVALLFVLVASACVAQEVKLPPSLKAMPGQWVVVAPTAIDGGAPRWELDAGLTEVDLAALFGPELSAKARGKVLTADRPGTYEVRAWNAKGDVASPIARCTITIIGTAPAPMPQPQPKDPPATPATKLYFLLVRPDGQAHPEFTRIISLSAWSTLTTAGHQYRDATLTEARGTGVDIPAGTLLPCVVLLLPKPDGGYRQNAIVPMPTTAEEVLALSKAVIK